MSKINTIIFDLGGVLIDWNPEYLYKKVFSNEQDMRFFLDNICTKEWNEEQDAGYPLEKATKDLIKNIQNILMKSRPIILAGKKCLEIMIPIQYLYFKNCTQKKNIGFWH